MSKTKVDDLDAKILRALLQDARTSFAKIADACGVSTIRIHKRFDALKKSGIIAGTSIITKPERGFNFSLIVELKVEQQYIQSIISKLKTIPELLNAYAVAGKYDIHAVFIIESLEQRDKIRVLLSDKKGITKLKFLLVDRAFAFYPKNLVMNGKDD